MPRKKGSTNKTPRELKEKGKSLIKQAKLKEKIAKLKNGK